MATLEIESDKALERAMALLNNIPHGFNRAFRSVMKQSAQYVRSNHVKALRKRYAISAGNVRAEEKVSVQYSHRNGAQVVVNFAGKRIPLARFDGAAPQRPTFDMNQYLPVNIGTRGAPKWRRVHPGVTARGHVLRHTAPQELEGAFVAAFSSGHIGIFERINGGDVMSELYSPSTPQMLGSQEVSDLLLKEVDSHTEDWIEQVVLKILNGE